MKKYLLFAASALFCCGAKTSLAQSVAAPKKERCGSALDLESLKKTEPASYKKWLRIEQFTQNYIKARQSATSGSGTSQRVSDPQVTVTIPVVVHVVYNTNEQNISDAQIQSQIDVLNEDYRRRNVDASQTPTISKQLTTVYSSCDKRRLSR